MAKAAKAKTKVVAATGVAVGRQGGEDLAQRIEAAMVTAIKDANAKGISDPDKIRALMLKARDKILAT